MIYSVFSNLSNQFGKWKDELHFYQGDWSNIDLSTDNRFCAVDGKRRKSILLGTVALKDSDFPIQYPLLLNSGHIINEDDYDKPTDTLKAP